MILTKDGLGTADQPAMTIPAAPTEPLSKPALTQQREIVTVAPSTTWTALSRQPDPSRQAALRLDRAVREEQPRSVAEGIRVLQALLDRNGGTDPSGDLKAALRRGQRWQEQRARRRKAVITRLQEAFDVGLSTKDLLAQAQDLVMDADATEDERAVVHDIQAHFRRVEQERKKAHLRQEMERREAEAQELTERRAAARQEVIDHRERALTHARIDQVRPLGGYVRGALKKAAKEGRVTTWPDLQRRTGQSQLGRLSHQEKVEVLVLVESDTRAEDPMWSVLLAATGDPASLRVHRDVAHRLGRSLPTTDEDLVRQLTAERTELHRQDR
ncbi:AAA family ATPase [Actinacidiphila glaucinigra]|uniref:hypothetical protein n=1 Tax=Actinacidiphila glaucinigra TaxID=235986 RepID=UPI00366BDFAE